MCAFVCKNIPIFLLSTLDQCEFFFLFKYFEALVPKCNSVQERAFFYPLSHNVKLSLQNIKRKKKKKKKLYIDQKYKTEQFEIFNKRMHRY